MSEQKTRYIPKNVLQSTKIFGLKKRNLIEGIIWAVALCLLINLIPFVLKVKIILFVTVTLVSLLLNGMGIHENAISATVLAYLQYKWYTNKFRYRRLCDERENPKPIIDDNTGKVRTIVEYKTIANAKKFIGQ